MIWKKIYNAEVIRHYSIIVVGSADMSKEKLHDEVKEESPSKNMPITIRVTEEMSEQINEILETEGFSSRADVVYGCTRFFMEDIRLNIYRAQHSFLYDKKEYEKFLSCMAQKYEGLLEDRPDRSKSENITFRAAKIFFQRVQAFNLDTLRYRNAQSFMRVAIVWYYYTIHGAVLNYDMRNAWKNEFKWVTLSDLKEKSKIDDNDE